MRPRVLLVEDSTSLAILYKQYVKDEPYDIFHVETGREAIQFIERSKPQLIILDLKLPDMSGEDVLDWINENEIPTSVIIATAHGSVDLAVNLIQKGAEDFLEKPINADRLKTSVALHLKRAKLENLVENIQSTFDRHNYHGFIGSSLPMQAVYKTIDAVAPTSASVFIVGESGTGKEVCAEAIHQQSDRRDKPFIAINCGAIPRDLMESEIFGHVKGAFTGATTDRKGAATLAHGGTLFLDELCEMELEMQKKLLRFLQTGTYTPLGATREMKVDVRIICATNRDPLTEVEEGRFREDLYYRVHVVPIDMPPLRERGSDIVTLAKHFLTTYAKQDKKKFNNIDSEAQHVIKHYDWPGNVRQLQNIIRNIVVLNNEDKVSLAHLPAQLTRKPAKERSATIEHDARYNDSSFSPLENPPAGTVNLSASERESMPVATEESSLVPSASVTPVASPYFNADGTIRPMWKVEREAIQNAIAYCDGNVLNAAVMLELSPSTVYRKNKRGKRMKLISNNLEIPVVGEVWILLDSRIYGGIESHVVELATGLQSFHVNVRVVLVVEYDPPPTLIDKLNQVQIPVSYLWHLCPKPERSKTIPVKQITGAVAEHQPSVIHTHGYKAALLARSAKLFTRTFPRLISTFHAGETPKGRVWLYDWLDRYSACLSDHCFAVSQTIQSKIPSQSELLNNFVSIPNQHCRYKQIAFVGRLSHEKGADRFIDIARHIPDIEFSIYGDGPEKPRLIENAPANVIFHGHQNDMDAVWCNISALVISSRYEGLPMAALEAMARGIVVISLDVGRLPDLIEDGHNGFLAYDIPALTDKLNHWLGMSHSEQYPMRHKAIETIKDHYSSRNIIPILIERYQIENHT